MLKKLFQKPQYEETDAKIFYNVGATMDIPTGRYVRGEKGEYILNGGLGAVTAITGRGNSFKSAISMHMLMAAMDKILDSDIATYVNAYDTEMNMSHDRVLTLAQRHPHLRQLDIFGEGLWSITDKSHHTGDEWFKILKEFLTNEKEKNKKKLTLKTPMLSLDGRKVETIVPTFGLLDSLTEFETKDVLDMQNKNDLGESGGNTIHMRLGLNKARLMMELPALCYKNAHYMVLTSHLGTELNMQQGPVQTPTKNLQHLRQGEKVKGVSDKFFFLTTAFWAAQKTTLLVNQNTKGVEYPRDRENPEIGSTDLNMVTLKQLRSKSGPSGYTVDVIVSQSEGVLSSLTEFHLLRTNKGYGLEGNNVTYNTVFYPDVKIGRTTVRKLLDEDPLLARSVKFLADMWQIQQFFGPQGIVVPSPQELYAKLDKKYGFKKLLETRDYWTFNQYDHKVPFLSTMDLIQMYYDKYVPYWLK